MTSTSSETALQPPVMSSTSIKEHAMQSAIGTGPQEQAQRRRARRQKICFAFGNLGQSAF